ncbi:MAG: 4Fe-4S dicluster domain-containing protein [Candidatus Gastranaerophilales bacterium]|nr:4Fe-4S dicluster domain-containing protein [Candidatus Gastranaerophilales bacterium]
MNIDDLLATLKYKADSESHLIPDQTKCAKCTNRVCEHVCPACVYEWSEEEHKLLVAFENCLECGACKIACVQKSIAWRYPSDSKGVTFKSS